MQECDIILQYIALTDAIIGRLSTASQYLKVSTNQIHSIGSEVRQEVVPQIRMGIARLKSIAHECSMLSWNAQIIAQRANSQSFKVIAEQIHEYVKSIDKILVRIDSLGKKIHFIVDTIEKLMTRVDEFAKSSVEEGRMIIVTTNDLMESLQAFRQDLEKNAFATSVSNRSPSEILSDQLERSHLPSSQHTNLHPTIQHAIELMPVFAHLMDAQVFVCIPTTHEGAQTGMYIAGAHGAT